MIDSHTHLSDARFDEDRSDALARARAAGVAGFVDVGCWAGAVDREKSLALARSEPDVWCALGVHPHDVTRMDAGSLEHVRELAADPRCVAIGETGLDHHYDHSPPDEQRRWFTRFVELAADLDKPVVIHSRAADAETLEVLRAVGWGRGVIHCFTGGPALLDGALELGFHIGFTGIVTFRAAANVVDAARRTPLARTLVETDAPYLAPIPHRGQRNEPAFLPFTVARLAEVHGLPTTEMSAATSANARRLFGLVP